MDDKIEDWMDDYLFPMIDLLELVVDLKCYTTGLTKLEFFKSMFAKKFIQQNLILIAKHLESIKERYPKIFNIHGEIPWDKFIKIGKLIEHNG